MYEYRSTGKGDGIDAHGNQMEIARFGYQDRRQLSVISASGINLFQKDRRHCGKRGDEMVFPSANAALRAICAVSAGRKILEGDLFDICEKCFEIGGDFCIQADKRLTIGEEDETTAGAGVVESIPCRRRSRWPGAEATELGLCLQRSADVNRGIVAK